VVHSVLVVESMLSEVEIFHGRIGPGRLVGAFTESIYAQLLSKPRGISMWLSTKLNISTYDGQGEYPKSSLSTTALAVQSVEMSELSKEA
jgi:hypothetical protein